MSELGSGVWRGYWGTSLDQAVVSQWLNVSRCPGLSQNAHDNG
jgi:hypothetical protein